MSSILQRLSLGKASPSSLEDWPDIAREHLSIMSPAEIATVTTLVSLGQQHVFAEWESMGINDDLKHGMLSQAEKLISSGLADYLKRAKTLLSDSKNGENPFTGWTPSVPSGVALNPELERGEFEEFEALGMTQIGRCGFVLVAGGLGERLGFNGIKVSLPAETLTFMSFLELYCQQILNIQERYTGAKTKLPLAIMVSDDTLGGTLALLQQHSFFGLDESQVTILKQEKVAALSDNDAHIAVVNKYEIETKPHGHGDVHQLMHTTGTAERWREQGILWCYFFQDTNGLCFLSLSAALGVSSRFDMEVNSMSIPRKAKQAIGAIAKLKHSNGNSMTVNVEYNQLDPLLRATVSPEGDVNDPETGLSPYPGNINQLVFKLEPYISNLKKSNGVLGEFVNPKYADSSRQRFKKPTRLECMMQDYPKTLSSGARVGFSTAPAWLWSPCKNNAADARASVEAGIPAGSAMTAESDYLRYPLEFLRILGAHVAIAPPETFLGITASLTPRAVFHPSFAIFFSEVASRFPFPAKVFISERASLLIKGNVIIESLDLDGAVRFEASPGTTLIVRAGSRKISNAGHRVRECSPAASEVLQMRGYVFERVAEEVVRTEGSEGVFVFTGRVLISEASYEPDNVGSTPPASCFSCC